MWDAVLLLLETYSAELGSVGIISGALFAFWGKIKSILGFTPKPQQVEVTNPPPAIAQPTEVIVNVDNAPPKEAMTTMTLDQYESRLATKITEAEANLKTAHDAEKTQLQQKIDELRKRAANPEQALAEAKATIAKLEHALTREGNNTDIADARMAEAREALEAGDFSVADDIFAEIEAREQLAVERTARAAFARGEIAAQDIRWADAAKHYARAAALHPTYAHLYTAHEFTLRNGDYAKAIALGTELLKLAKAEFGDTHKKYASALNLHAATLKTTGNYDLAEPLLKQAIEIGKQTLGENHPDYAIRLNNLAALYEATGKYDLAEPLYKQAIKIDKQTLGENHPDYATRLNNLAALYETTGKYDHAEPLYNQAFSIFDASLGPDHPSTKTVKANYQDFLKNRP